MTEWLRDGWILELRAPSDQFYIGGFGLKPQDLASFQAIDSGAVRIWTPEFYNLEQTRPEVSVWAVQISRLDLIEVLNSKRPGTHETAKGRDGLRPPVQLVRWSVPQKPAFISAVAEIQKLIFEGRIKKAVPVVGVEGWTANSSRTEFLRDRLTHGLLASSGNGLRVYGRWRDEGISASGFLGLTPEDLLSVQGGGLETMAVAGTSVIPLGATELDLERFANNLLTDPKELHEHSLVRNEIAGQLQSQEGVRTVTVGETGTVRFRQLLHLVTPIRAQVDPALSAAIATNLIHRLHPTPALGLAPKSPDLSILKRVDESLLPRERAGFGAPFVVLGNGWTEAVVAIRQLRWRTEAATENRTQNSDRMKLEILAGCGVVEGSQAESEWIELQAKRLAITDSLGVSRETPRPLKFAGHILSELLRRGVRHFVVCAGARNAPLVVALDRAKKSQLASQPTSQLASQLEIDAFFDERSAGFYALGVARSSGHPVAVVTTSGTAVTELHSAMAEADLSGVPLIALTADRPKRLRYSGAPQSMRQDSIFSHFAEGSLDLEEGDLVLLPAEFKNRPWHLNICFEEPLLVDAEETFGDEMHGPVWPTSTSASKPANATKEVNFAETSFTKADYRAIFTAAMQVRAQHGGVIIVGRLSETERPVVREFLAGAQMPCLLEGPSGLRGDPALKGVELISGDRVLGKKIVSGGIGQVLRLGGIPTSRVWRDLDDPSVACLTTSISALRFSGLGRGSHIEISDFRALREWTTDKTIAGFEKLSNKARDAEAELLALDRAAALALEQSLLMNSRSEPGWFRVLSQHMLHADLIYMGNSLPIRWWDWTATREMSPIIEVNRGVNGIDGQLSTALGLMRGSAVSGQRREAWIVVGDLTALYDLSAPWAMQLEDIRKHWKLRIVVINNHGGMIFRQVLKSAPSGSAPFENSHVLNFKDWAQMWGMEYRRLLDPSELSDSSKTNWGDSIVLEVVPDAQATERFWKDME